MWRDVEKVRVGDVVRGFFEWAFLWGDVDPHGGGLGACEPDGCTVVVEVRASRRRKSPLILPEVVMTAGRKKKLRSL